MSEQREFVFRPRDFETVRRLIRDHAGICLGDTKADMVYSRVARRLRATRLSSFEAYLQELETNEREFEEFVNTLTTNLTAFFREPHHFPLLAELLRRHAGEHISLWSAACSTGEEVYSMAITALETLGDDTTRVTVLGTDVDTQAVRAAERGIYRLERVEALGEERLKRFFLRGTGPNAGYARLRPEVRRRVRFRPMNLVSPQWAIRGPFHAIFCRNAMIYFDKSTQRRILERLRPLLHADGLLFAGHSESFSHCGDLFRSRGSTVYAPLAASAQEPAR